MADVIHQASRDIEAIRVIREQIATLAGDDEDFIRDTLEGETDLPALVHGLLGSIGEDEALAAGLKTYAADLAARRERFEKRAEIKRALVQTALEIAGQKTVETPCGTVSLAPVQPTAIITEESEIPAEFWKPQPPKLDKKALTSALKDKRHVPGATLSNGSSTIRITRR